MDARASTDDEFYDWQPWSRVAPPHCEGAKVHLWAPPEGDQGARWYCSGCHRVFNEARPRLVT